MSIELKDLACRHKFFKLLRNFFDAQDFLHIDTPYLLSANTPDPHIDPVFAYARYPHEQKYQLHTSPEIWLKKALSLGAPKIYEIARVFRDDPLSFAHAKEFTMIEWYRTQADLADLLKDCQEIFALAQEAAQLSKALQFTQISVSELFARHAHIDLPEVLREVRAGNYLKLNKILEDRGDRLPEGSNFVDAFFITMIKYIEPKFEPHIATVVTRWPLQLAALAAACPDDELFCDRFEIYYEGLEIANAYQECMDPKILSDRFEQENNERVALKKPVFSIDKGFLAALEGQPKTAGIALGVDRLLMAALGKKHLKDLIWGYEFAQN